MNNKIKTLIVVLLLNIAVSLSDRDIFAADESIIMFKGVNATCNVYPKPTATNALTYVNPLFQRDAPYLGSSGNYYKTMVAGVEGWISKSSACLSGASIKKVSNMPVFTYANAGVSLRGLDVSRYQSAGNKLYFNSVYNTNYITINQGYTDLPSGLKNNTIYYSYDGNYFYTNYNTMVANYKSKTRSGAVNAKNPYYDYYQYLPIRTVSKISGANLDKRLLQKQSNAANKLKETKTFKTTCSGSAKYFTNTYNGYYSNTYKQGNSFASLQNNYRVNSGVLFGVMLNESANGTSNLSRHYNNPFGWGAVDSCPNSASRYSSMSTAISKYYQNMSSSYANPVHDSGGKGTHLGNKKSGANVRYASDPHWGYKNAFNYRKADELAGNIDKNKYQIGIINSGSNAVDGSLSNEYTKVYTSASTSSKSPFYYERNGASVVIQGTSGSFYRIQNDAATNGSSVYILKSKVRVANSPVISTPQIGVSYQKTGNTHYVWGLNTSGQLGNGKKINVSQTTKVNLASVIPKGEVIKSVLKSNSNIFILTASGNVYSSGSNTYGQRSYTAKPFVFSKMNPFNVKISYITLSGNRLSMAISGLSGQHYFVGQNGWNATSNKFNRTTSYPVKVIYSKGTVVSSYYYNYSISKTSGIYYYSKGYTTKTITYSYDKSKRLSQRMQYNLSKGKRTYAKRLSYSNGIISHKKEYYYVNGRLSSTTSRKAVRYSTYYSKGKATKTIANNYSSKGKLLSSKRIATRK